MSRAKEDLMDQLHGALAQHFKLILDRAKEGDGEIKASDLNVIRQFLKDNGIEAVETPANPLGQLTDALPFEVGESDSNVVEFGRKND